MLHVFFPILREILWHGLVAEAIPYCEILILIFPAKSLSLHVKETEHIRCWHDINIKYNESEVKETGLGHSKQWVLLFVCICGWCVQLYSQPQYFTTCGFLNIMHYVVVMKKKLRRN